jgi:hypothetical protein
MIFPLDLPSIQNHLLEHFERHFSSSRKIEANTVHAMINHPWLIKPEIAAIDVDFWGGKLELNLISNLVFLLNGGLVHSANAIKIT